MKRGGWRLAGGGEVARLRHGAAFGEGALAAPEVPPHGRLPSGSEAAWPNVDRVRMAARGPLPPGPGHRKPRAATWWAGAGNPRRRSSRASEGTWNFGQRENLEDQFVITPEGQLQAYVSVSQPHGHLEFFSQSSREVKQSARCKWHSWNCEAREIGRPRVIGQELHSSFGMCRQRLKVRDR